MLERIGAVDAWQQLMGPADPVEAKKYAPHSLRARLQCTCQGVCMPPCLCPALAVCLPACLPYLLACLLARMHWCKMAAILRIQFIPPRLARDGDARPPPPRALPCHALALP